MDEQHRMSTARERHQGPQGGGVGAMARRPRLPWPAIALLAALQVALVATGCSDVAKDAGGDAGASLDAGDVASQIEPDTAAPEDSKPSGPVLLAVEPAEGPTQGLTSVELVGLGLDTAKSVWFGDSKALDVEILGEDRLRCRTPPHPAGEVTVRVLREDDKALPLPELSLDLAYRYIATVRVDEVEPTTGPTDGATLVTIRGSGFLPGTQFIFGTKLAISPTILDEFNATALLPAGAVGVVDVIAANQDGQARLVDGFTYTEAASPPELQGVTLSWIKPERLAPKGGTKVELRYEAPTTLGPVLGVRIGPLDASKLEAGTQGPQSLLMVGPAGSPGWADVRLFFASGVAVFPKKVRFASDLPRLAAILPGRGAQSGGTLVDLVGDGVDTLSVVQFAGKDSIGIEVVDAGLARTRTPPAEAPGPATVVARFGSKQSPKGQSLLKNAYVYFDPAQEAWGTWGGPIDRALNVTVMRADWPGGVVADALVVIGDGKDVALRGMTDQRGQVVISTVGLAGPLDVSASKPGWGAATIAGTSSENATLLIRKYPEQGTGTFEWPKKFYSDGTIRGRVLNAAKYAGLPRGRCKAGAPPGAACAPCGGGLACSAGTSCLAADAPVWPATGVTATATGLCLQPCAKDADCGDEGWECRFVASVPTQLPNPTTETGANPAAGGGGVPSGAVAPVAACIPRIGKAQTRCETTQTWMFSTNPDPGPGAIVDDKGNFEIQTRLGSLAVACRAGYVDAKTGAFVGLWLGVKRSVEVPDDIHPVAIDVSLDTRLGRSLPVRMAGLPMGPDSVGKIRSMTAWLDLGGEGVLEMAAASSTARTDVLVLQGLPTSLHGALSGLRYELYGGLKTEFGDEGAPLSLGHFMQQQPSEGDGMVWWPKGEPGPSNADAGSAPAVATATGAAGSYAVGRGGRILYWTGGSWTPQAQPTDADLVAIWLDPTLDDGWVGGTGGTLLRRDPTLGWQAMPSPTNATIIGLAGAAPGVDGSAVWLLTADGALWRRGDGAWVATAEGPWPVGSEATTQGEGPTALARLDDGGLAVATSDGAVFVAPPTTLTPGGTPVWTKRIAASGRPLHAVTGASAADLWACGVDGRVLHAVGASGPAVQLATGTEASLLGLLRVGTDLHVVGASGTWLEVLDAAAPGAKVNHRTLPGVSADLRGLAPTSAGLVSVGEPVLSLERWLEMPSWLAPLPDEPVPAELKWTWPGGSDAHLQWLQITTFWQLSFWDIVVAGHRTSVVLPDFSQIGGWQPLPTGPLRMRLSRLFAPSLTIDHFSQDQLFWYAWTTWAFTQQMSELPAGSN